LVHLPRSNDDLVRDDSIVHAEKSTNNTREKGRKETRNATPNRTYPVLATTTPSAISIGINAANRTVPGMLR